MRNTLNLIRQNDSGGPRHSGWRIYRCYVAYINGVRVEEFREDSPRWQFASNRYLDEVIETWVELYERALSCKCVRGRVKDFDPDAGREPAGGWGAA